MWWVVSGGWWVVGGGRGWWVKKKLVGRKILSVVKLVVEIWWVVGDGSCSPFWPNSYQVKTQRKVMSLFRDFLQGFSSTHHLRSCLQNNIAFFLFGFCCVWKSTLDKSFHFVCFPNCFGVCLFPTIFTFLFKKKYMFLLNIAYMGGKQTN